MSFFARAFPQPMITLVILGLWMALASSFSLGNLLLGTVLALLIPQFTKHFWPDQPRIARPVRGLMLVALVIYDIVVANLQVARLVLGPISRLRPQLVELPLDIEDPFVATVLGSIISLTPGTVSIEIDTKERVLLIHALDVDDKDALIASIKARYEAPLKEIFKC